MYAYGYFNSFKPVASGVVPFDADAQAFITAASITDPTQQSAVNQLVVDLKGYSLWTKMRGIYPMIGGTSTSMKWNLKDPRDLNAAYRLSFAGGWTFSQNGADPSGTTAYADTFFTPTTWNNEHLCFYSGENTATATAIDIGSVSTSGNRYLLSAGVSSASSTLGAFGDPTLTGTDSASGFHAVSVNGTTAKLYKNNTNTDTDTVSSLGAAAGSVWIGAANNIGYYSNRQCRFASFGTGLSDTDVSNLYTAVQTFQTTLGRSVGPQTVSDADAQAFVTAADIQDQVQAEAVNQLVVDLKAASIWTDIEAGFPFVGGNATAHRYDLKSATALGTFAGGVTHNSDGVTFNGTTGFFDSGWALSVGNLYDRHYSKYMKTMSGSNFDGRFDNTNAFGGSYTGATTLYQVGCNNLPTSFSQAISANAVTCINVESNTVGKVYNDGNLVHTTAAAINASPDWGNMYIGALSTASGASIYHATNVAFATYGKALNSTKQAALNTAIKTFNTTLGR